MRRLKTVRPLRRQFLHLRLIADAEGGRTTHPLGLETQDPMDP